MTQKYQVTYWKKSATTAAPNSTQAMLSIEEMLNITGQDATFIEAVVGDYRIEGLQVGTNSLAVVAKYLIQPWQNNEFKHPLGAYLAALTDEAFSYELNDHEVNQESEFTEGQTTFDIRTVKDWVEAYLVMYSEENSEQDGLLERFTINRIEHAVSVISTEVSPAMANFISRAIDTEYLMDIYKNDDGFSENSIVAHISGKKSSALFKFNNEEQDDLFKLADKNANYTMI